jgi:membrane protease YdiL (CAAX protease family)
MEDLTTTATVTAVFCVLPRCRKSTSWGMGWVVWLMLATCTIGSFTAIVTQALPLSLGLSLNQILAVLMPSLLILRVGKQGLKAGLRLRWPGGMTLLFAAMVGAGIQVVSGVFLALASPWLGEIPPELVALYPKTLQELWPMLLAGVLVAGICEEVMFRGVIQGVLSRRSVAGAVVISSVLFGLFHFNLWQFVTATVAGLFLGWMVERSGSLLTSIAVHMVVNTMALSYSAFSGKVPTDELEILPAISLLIVGLVGLNGFIRSTRNGMAEPSPLRKLSTRVPWRAWISLVLVLSIVIPLVITIQIGWWGFGKLGFDLPTFGITRESNVLFVDPRRIPTGLLPDDRVFFESEGKSMAAFVVRADRDSVIVSMEGTELPVRRESVYFKLLWVGRASPADPQ